MLKWSNPLKKPCKSCPASERRAKLRAPAMGVHLVTVLILRNLAPSPPSEGGEGWGEEGHPNE